MAIRAKGKNKWEVVVYAGLDPITGKQRQTSQIVVGNRGDAKDAEAKLRLKARSGDLSPTSSTVDELLDRWLQHIEARGRSPWTLRGYRTNVGLHIKPSLGSTKLKDLRASHLDSLYDRLLKDGLSSSTVRQVHAILSAALHQGMKWGLIERDVARQASPPSVHRQPREAPTPEQVQALIKAAEDRDPNLAAFIMIAALTGARRGEMCALRWRDIAWDRRELTIRESVFDGDGPMVLKDTKSHQQRTISLDDAAFAVLKKHQEMQQRRYETYAATVDPCDDPFVFSPAPNADTPMRPSDVSHDFAELRTKVGLTGLVLHDLRHFMVTMLLDAGVPLPTVSKRAGHRSTIVTATIYAHAVQRTDQGAAAVLGNLLTPPAPQLPPDGLPQVLAAPVVDHAPETPAGGTLPD